MFANEVDYRLAKWILANLKADGVITEDEMHLAWINIAEYYKPPFLEVEDMTEDIGDGVIIDAR